MKEEKIIRIAKEKMREEEKKIKKDAKKNVKSLVLRNALEKSAGRDLIV